MADLIETVKKIVQGVLNESSPCNVLFGTVTSANPLEITVEQKLKLTKEFLILTKNVVNYWPNYSNSCRYFLFIL